MGAAHPLTPTELADLRVTFALLDLPVRIDMDGGCCVLHLEDGCTSHAEARALRLIGRRTDAYRLAP